MTPAVHSGDASAAPMRTAGFTLMELVVVTLVVSMVLVIAASLLMEANRLALSSMTPILRTDLRRAEALLRSDAQRATSASASDLWSVQPLRLRVDDEVVSWRLEGGHLVRQNDEVSGQGDPIVPLQGFRWRREGRAIWFELRPEEPRMTPVATRIERGLFSPRDPTLRLTVATRRIATRAW